MAATRAYILEGELPLNGSCLPGSGRSPREGNGFLGDCPTSACGSDPGSFQIIAFALGPCESLCAPFKSGVSLSHIPLTLLKVSPAGLQSQTF